MKKNGRVPRVTEKNRVSCLKDYIGMFINDMGEEDRRHMLREFIMGQLTSITNRELETKIIQRYPKFFSESSFHE